MSLQQTLTELESWIPKRAIIQKSISDVSIGWQISHCLKVMNGVTSLLVKSNPEEYKWSFNWIRTMVFLFKKIPKGRAKAPKAVRPVEEELTKEELIAAFKKAKTQLEEALKTAPNAFFEHPYFGLLKKDKALYFLELHNRHHLNIIKDIAKSVTEA